MNRSVGPGASLSGVSLRLRGFVSDVGALSLLQVLQRLPGLILLPIISRSLGAAGWGIWTLFFVAGEALGTLCDMALDEALVRFVAGSVQPADHREYFYSLLATVTGLSLAVAAGLGLAAGPAARLLFGAREYAPFVYLLCFYLVSESFDNLALNMLRALLDVKAFVTLEATQLGVRTALVAAVLLDGRGLWWGLAIYMAVQVIWLVAELAVIYRKIGFQRPAFKYLRACAAYSLPLAPTRYAGLILNYSDRLIIASFLGPAAAGVYAASYDLALLIWQAVNPIRLALYPMLSRLWDQGLTGEAGQYLTRSMKGILFITIPGAAGLTLLAPRLLALISTEDFVRVSYVVVPLAAIGVIFQALSLIFSLVLRMRKNTRAIAIGLGISAAVHLALNLLLIPLIGLAGGALASVAGYLLDLVILGALAWRAGPLRLPVWEASVFVAASALMAPPVWWLARGGGWLAIVAAAAAGALIYGVAALALRGITIKEFRVLLNRSTS